MNRFTRIAALSLLLMFALGSTSQAITRVAKKLYVVDISSGYGSPVGDYDGIPGDDFVIDGVLYKFPADQVYDGAFWLSTNYGMVFADHLLISAGIRYTHHNLKDTIGNREFAFSYVYPLRLNQWDLDLDFNYQPVSIYESFATPYVGLGFFGGITNISAEGFESRNELTLGARLNFGAELKVFTAPSKKSFVTLASVNSWDFAATNDRPRYLNIGGAIKYYFRL
jgi:hypothetical protein